MSSLLRDALHALAERAARAYVVGPDLADAIRACVSLATQDFSTTVCAWSSAGAAPAENAQICTASIDAVANENLDCYVSLKARDLAGSRALTSEVLNRARSRAVGIHFDSMGPETADETFSLIAAMGHRGGDLGCTVPGRWARSLTDADRAIDLDLRVRVVKGQWIDPAAPHADPRDGFLRVIDRLAGRVRQAAVATHDPDLACAALARLRDARTPSEIELLFGLPYRRVLSVARGFDVPVRIYIPYGHAWLPYAFGQIKHNPRIAWWLLRDLCTGDGPRLNYSSRRPAP